MWGAASAANLAARFARLTEELGGDAQAARTLGQQRHLLAAIREHTPATLNKVAETVERGAPVVSRAVDTLVRAGLVIREPDPDNRRRLALRLSPEGSEFLNKPLEADGPLKARLEKLATSELRAVERALEILERLPQ